MSNAQCRVCGAELLPATAFCRKCGSAATGTATASEQPTAVFGQAAESVTERLDPRPTSPDRRGLQAPSRSIHDSASADVPKRSKALIIIAILAVTAGILTVVAIARLRSQPSSVQSLNVPSVSSNVPLYPGAQSIVDMTSNNGSRTVQLQTTDSLDRVEKWYQTNLTLTKTVRLTPGSVVMKNEKVTVTLANDANKTIILIKQAP